jgi:hypothetical protein
MWSLAVCGFASVSLLAFSLTAPTSAGGLAAMAAGALGTFLTPLAAFSRGARTALWCLGWALALATWLTAFDVTTAALHTLAVLAFVIAGTDTARTQPTSPRPTTAR